MNARKEILKTLEGMPKVSAFRITHENFLFKGTEFTEEVLECFDFEYDAGYGSQELFGCILFEDGSWLEREEYDGSEWWEYHRAPTVEDLLQ